MCLLKSNVQYSHIMQILVSDISHFTPSFSTSDARKKNTQIILSCFMTPTYILNFLQVILITLSAFFHV